MKKSKLIASLLLAGVLCFSGCAEADMTSNTDNSEVNEVVEAEETKEEAKEVAEEAKDDVNNETEAVSNENDGEEENGEEVKEETVDLVSAETEEKIVDLNNIDSVEFAGLMKMGWNLGNTLDATGSSGLDSETSWQQPKTTQELISYVKSVGFTSIRIPISWGKHTDGDFKIDPEWMARVKEVVDYAYNEDMYVIINSHHDNDYYYPSEENMDRAKNYLATIWTQIADEFKDYDNHLVYESMNEPRLANTSIEWWFAAGDPEGKAAIERICELNQIFVDTVRASGGNNKDRFIMVPSYAASPDFATNSSFSMPEDPSNRIMLSVHAYTPYDFAGNKNGYSTWSTSKNSEFNFMGKLNSMFALKGYGVVIGEFGATNKDNNADRILWAEGYCSKAASYGMSYFIWDNGATGVGEENFGVIDRKNLKLYFPDVFEAYASGYANK